MGTVRTPKGNSGRYIVSGEQKWIPIVIPGLLRLEDKKMLMRQHIARTFPTTFISSSCTTSTEI
jgi:hypothetical protein